MLRNKFVTELEAPLDPGLKVPLYSVCRLKDLKEKAPTELKAYYECLDYYRC